MVYSNFTFLLTEEQGLSSSSLGKVKLELAYKVKQQCLSVMVRHVKDLVRSYLCTLAMSFIKKIARISRCFF